MYDEPVPQVLSEETDPNNFAGWREYSIPMGNGLMGVNLFGGVKNDRIQITENSLQDSNKSIGGLNNFSETYLDFDYDYEEVDNYQRQLSLNEGISTVQYDYQGNHYTREYFVNYPDKVMVIHLESEEPGKLDFTLRPTIPYLCDSRVVNGEEDETRGKSGEVVAEGDTITLAGEMEYYGLQYEGKYKVSTEGGLPKASNIDGNGVIEVTNADSATIVIGIDTNYDLKSEVFTSSDPKEKIAGNKDAHARVSEIMEAAGDKSYEELKQNHLDDYQSLYGRVNLDLGGVVPEDATTDELLAEYKKGSYDSSPEGLYLEELVYQFGRYLLISSSREGGLPTNLQGIWNVYQDPSWRAGMWHNINEQMNYWPAFTANLAETFIPYVEYQQAYNAKASQYATSNIEKYNPDGANEVYDDGWALGNSTWPYNISGSASHSGFGTGPFMTILFWDYYDFTRDMGILEKDTFPAISGMSKFLSKIVKEDSEGKLLAQHSFSPEVQISTESGTESYETEGCTFDQAMIYENHLDSIRAAELLGVSGLPEIVAFQEQLPLLDPILVGTSGQIKEYREESYYGEIGNEPTHRHTSQLVGVYPGTMINSSTPAWQDAAKVSLDKREGTPDRTKGWSKSHRAAIWARLYEGDRAYNNYQQLLKRNLMYNLFNDHGGSSNSSSKLFQVDGNYGAPAAVGEMLLQSHEGFIAPLPALPTRWANGSFRGLAARGNFEVSAQWADGQAETFEIVSKSGGECKLKYENISQAVVIDENGGVVPYSVEDEDMIVFQTTVGGHYQIENIPGHSTVQDAADLQLTVNPGKEMQVSWSASPDAVSYNVYRAVESEAKYEKIAENVTETKHISPIANGSQATYKVTAVSSDGKESKGIYQTIVLTEKPTDVRGYFMEDGSVQIQIEDDKRTEDTEYIIYKEGAEGNTEIKRSPYTVMSLDGITESDKLLLSKMTELGESKPVEIKYYEAIAENVCLGKKATSDRKTSGSYPISNGFDGDMSSRIGFSKGAGPIELEIDLETEWNLKTLSIYEWKDKNVDTRSGNTKCEISTDGKSWTTVFEGESLKGGENLSFDMGGKAASKIRLTFENLKTEDAVSIYEISCSAEMEICQKAALFQAIVEADEMEKSEGFGNGVPESALDVYRAAKKAAIAELETTMGQTQESVDLAEAALRSAMESLKDTLPKPLQELIEEAKQAIIEITPDNPIYSQERYDVLVSALDAAKAGAENPETGKDDLNVLYENLKQALEVYRGEGKENAGNIILDLAEGFYEGQQTISLSSENDAVAEFYYTLDGTQPTKNSMRTSKEITLPFGMSWLKVIGYTVDGAETEIASGKYMCRPEQNLALEQTVEVSSQSGGSNDGAKAVDGDIATRWASKGESQSISIAFETPIYMDSIYIDEFKNSQNVHENRLFEYTIEYKETEAGEWMALAAGSMKDSEIMAFTKSSEDNKHAYDGIGFSPVTAVELRITGPAGEDASKAAISFYEVEIYGEELQNAKTILAQMIKTAEDIDLSGYTDESAAKLIEGIETAKAAESLENADEILTAAEQLKNLIGDLELSVPELIKQPASIEVNVGETAEFTVEAVGKKLTYQWQRLIDGIWHSIDGAVGATYRVETIEENNGTAFRCIIGDAGGYIASDKAELILKGNEEITAQEVADMVTVQEKLEEGVKAFPMPEVPEGFQIAIQRVSPEGIVGADGSITMPKHDTEIEVVFVVTRESDQSQAETKAFCVLIPGVNEGDPSEPTVPENPEDSDKPEDTNDVNSENDSADGQGAVQTGDEIPLTWGLAVLVSIGVIILLLMKKKMRDGKF